MFINDDSVIKLGPEISRMDQLKMFQNISQPIFDSLKVLSSEMDPAKIRLIR